MHGEPDYRPAWQRLRLLNWTLFAWYPAGPALFVVLLGLRGHLESKALFPAPLVVWVLGLLVLNGLHAFWPCPRCRKRFFARWFWSNPLAWKCLHCGLPKGAPGPRGNRPLARRGSSPGTER